MRTSTMTQSTPTRMTRTITTRPICTSEHSSAPLVVFPVFMMCHDPLGSSRSRVCHLHAMLLMCRSPWYSSSSLSTSTCPSPSSSSPVSWCTLTCTPTSTNWTPWIITCATPPRGATKPTTSPSPSQVMSPTTRSPTSSSTPRVPFPTLLVIGPGHRWHYARQATHWSTPRIHRLPQSGRCVCQSVVIVCRVRKNGETRGKEQHRSI